MLWLYTLDSHECFGPFTHKEHLDEWAKATSNTSYQILTRPEGTVVKPWKITNKWKHKLLVVLSAEDWHDIMCILDEARKLHHEDEPVTAIRCDMLAGDIGEQVKAVIEMAYEESPRNAMDYKEMNEQAIKAIAIK